MRPAENVLSSLSKSNRPTQRFNFSKLLFNTLAINQKSFKQIMASSSLISKRLNKFTHSIYFVKSLALNTSSFVLEHKGIMARLNAVIEMTIDVSTNTLLSTLMTISSSR